MPHSERRRMLVTGGNGLVGNEIRRTFGGAWDIRSVDLAECDVTDPADCRREIAGFRPHVVVHCAAYTAVDRAESEEALALAVNGDGTLNVGRECRAHGAVFVTYGSDYVFDGTTGRPYREEDAARPLSAYGRSKLATEGAFREAGAEGLLIRSQWLYGGNGRNFVSAILEKARRGEPLRVVNDQVGCPTWARDLAEATRLLLSRGARGTFHFSNEGETSWHGFAAFILGHALPGGVSLAPVASRDAGYPAVRPGYSVLAKDKYRLATGSSPRPWTDAVLEFLESMNAGGPA